MNHAIGAAALGLTAAGMACGALTYAARWPGSQLFGRTLLSGRDPLEAALTVDDGPNGDTTLRLLDVLAKHQARATFFLIGRFVLEQPEVVRAVASAGHVVGNHTMTHPWMHRQSDARIREEIDGCNASLEDTLGAPVRFFRAPYGARRPYVLRYAREAGLTPVQWNVMPRDWNPHPPEEIARRIQKGIAANHQRQRGSNVLLHDGGCLGLGQPRMPTVEAVDRVLASFAADGIRSVGVDAWAETA